MSILGWRSLRRPGRRGGGWGSWVLVSTVVCLVLTLIAGAALANVKDWYEWCNDPATGKPKRALKVGVDPDGGDQLAQWLREAMANWNEAGTGWTFELTDQVEGADITVHSAPIPNNADGSVPVGRCRTDFDGKTGEVIGATITLNSSQSWGTSGKDTLDPVKTLKHELGHTMRLTHSELGNLLDEFISEGDHDCDPNGDDVDEAKDASSSTRPMPEAESMGARTGLRSGAAALTLDSADCGTVHEAFGVPVTVYPLEGVMLPDPLAVPEGLERVVVAAGVFPVEAEFKGPTELRLTWEQGAVSGLSMVGELHEHTLPPVDPSRMVPVRWVADELQPGGGSWVATPVEWALDLDGRAGMIAAAGGGIFGLAAPAEERPPASGTPAFSDLTGASPVVARALTDLRAMDIYRGYPDGTGQPGRNLMRLEFFTLAVRLGGGEAAAAGQAGTRPPFADDVPAWGWGYVNQAVAMGLARGYPDGTFRPGQDVTGNEALTVLVRVLGPEGDAVAGGGPWPRGYIEVGSALGLLEGIRDLVSGDLTAWLNTHINRGGMAVLTLDAAWTDARYVAGEAVAHVVTSLPSIAAASGWWRATIEVAAQSADCRRLVLARPVGVPERGAVNRLDVDEHPYLAPGAVLPGPGASAAVLGRDRTVRAVRP